MINSSDNTGDAQVNLEGFQERFWDCSSVRNGSKRKELANILKVDGYHHEGADDITDAYELVAKAKEFDASLMQVVLALNSPLFEINASKEPSDKYGALLEWYVKELMRISQESDANKLIENFTGLGIYNRLKSNSVLPDTHQDARHLEYSSCDKIAFMFHKAPRSQWTVGCLVIDGNDSQPNDQGVNISSRAEQEKHVAETIKRFQYKYKKMPSYIEVVVEKKEALYLKVDQWHRYSGQGKKESKEKTTWGLISKVVYVDYTAATEASRDWLDELRKKYEQHTPRLNHRHVTSLDEIRTTLLLPEDQNYESVCLSAVVKSSDKNDLEQLINFIRIVLQRDYCPLLVLYHPIPNCMNINNWANTPKNTTWDDYDHAFAEIRQFRWQASRENDDYHGKHMIVYWHDPIDVEQIQRYLCSFDSYIGIGGKSGSGYSERVHP